MKIIEIKCNQCKGTGLYRGMCELKGCAVICSDCKGTGKTTFKYEEFKRRVKRDDVVRVFESAFGFIHGADSKGGCSYSEWLKGAKLKPVKAYYCPYIFDRSKRHFEGCELIMPGDRIDTCQCYKEKNKCWEKY